MKHTESTCCVFSVDFIPKFCATFNPRIYCKKYEDSSIIPRYGNQRIDTVRLSISTSQVFSLAGTRRESNLFTKVDSVTPTAIRESLNSLYLVFSNVFAATVPESTCPAPTVVGENSVSIYTSKESSKWVTTILADFRKEGSPESPNLDVSQKVIRCNNQEILRLKVILKEEEHSNSSVESRSRKKKYHTNIVSIPPEDVIRFHFSGGKNILVFDEGLTVYRTNENEIGFAGILTNRPLKDDELFEVTLDRLITKHGESLGIGVTELTPTSIVYGSWMSLSTVILYNHKIYGKEPKELYGPDLRKLQVGSRVGVMRRKNGNVHFYVDGVDQGIAAINIRGPVYGVFDLYGNAVQASIAWD